MADGTAFVLGGTGGLRRRERGALRTWAGLGLVALVVALPLKGLYRFTGGTMEEGFMLAFPERMSRGDVANVDFLHLYGPGALDVLQGWYRLFGHTIVAERTFGLLQHLGIILALFTLARPWGRKAATAVGALSAFYVLTPIGLTAMAWNGGLALTLWAAVFTVRASAVDHPAQRSRAAIVAGVLGALALTYRPDLAIAVGLVLGWLVWSHRSLWRPVLIGAVVGLIPVWIHLVVAGPVASWRGMFLDPVFHLRAGRELPRPPSWSHLDGALQAIAESEPPWWPLPHLPASNALFLWFFVMLAGTAGFMVFALWLRGRGDRSARTATVLIVALVSAGILPQALQRPDSTHLTWVTCVSWPFAVVIVAEAITFARPRISAGRALSLGGAAALALAFTFTSLFTFRYYLLHVRVGLGQVHETFEIGRDERHFYFGSARAALAAQEAIDDLDRLAEPGDRLFVGPQDLRRTWYSDAVFYWLFPEMTPATYFMEMDPGLADAPGSRLAGDLESADYVLLTSFWAGWDEPNASMDFGSDVPNEIIARNFCQWGSYQNGLVRLYYRCR